jgi:hypothetical protein
MLRSKYRETATAVYARRGFVFTKNSGAVSFVHISFDNCELESTKARATTYQHLHLMLSSCELHPACRPSLLKSLQVVGFRSETH